MLQTQKNIRIIQSEQLIVNAIMRPVNVYKKRSMFTFCNQLDMRYIFKRGCSCMIFLDIDTRKKSKTSYYKYLSNHVMYKVILRQY